MFNFNLKRFICLLLPTAIRNGILDFFAVHLSPVKVLYCQFLAFRQKKLNDLSYNNQYPNFQRLLNNKFDKAQRRIRVYDKAHEPVIIWPIIDKIPGITSLVIHYNISSYYDGFTVELPSEFNDNIYQEVKIRKIINTYKFVGTKYQIIYS
jgi:hypothetical protein